MEYFRAIENILFENKFNKISLKLVSCAIIDNYMPNINDCIAGIQSINCFIKPETVSEK
jgi:hypothetical protein